MLRKQLNKQEATQMTTLDKEELKSLIEAEFALNLTRADREAWDHGEQTENTRDMMEKFSVEAWTDCGDCGVIIDQFVGDHVLNCGETR